MENLKENGLRARSIKRFANCLFGEIERGETVAQYKAPTVLAGTNLITDNDHAAFVREIEAELNALLTRQRRHSAFAEHCVNIAGTINSTLHLVASAKHA